MESMKIRHSKPMPIALLVIGILLLVLALLTMQPFSILLGLILTLLGILMLINPMLVITAEEVQVRNPLGMTLKRFPVRNFSDLRIDGKNLVHTPEQKRIARFSYLTERADIEALRARLGA